MTDIREIRSTVHDTASSASLVEGYRISATQQVDTAIIRGLVAGPGIHLELVDADDSPSTGEKVIRLSTQPVIPDPPPDPDPHPVGLIPGTYYNTTVTVDDDGRISTLQNGIPLNLLGEVNIGENIGNGVPVFAGKTGVKLQFRSVVPGEGIDVQEFGDQIIISHYGGGGEETNYCNRHKGVIREFVPAECAIEIPAGHQVLVYGDYRIDGVLFVRGKLVVL